MWTTLQYESKSGLFCLPTLNQSTPFEWYLKWPVFTVTETVRLDLLSSQQDLL